MRRRYGRSKEDYLLIKEKVRKLRKGGKSYSEIIAKHTISKGTISLWCKDIKLTSSQIKLLGSRYDIQLRGAKANQMKRRKEVEEIQKIAKKEIGKPTTEEFKIAGAMLYWAEGNKTNHFGMTNSNPKMIKFMIKWFQQFLDIEPKHLKAYLHLHAGQNVSKIVSYWSKLTGIPKSRFGKSYIKPSGTGHRKNILYNGTIRVSYYNKNYLYKTLSWIETYANYITGR